MSYIFKELDFECMSDIYVTHLNRHFPPEEVKSLNSIERMWKENSYFALGMYSKNEHENSDIPYGADELMAYAFFVKSDDATLLLLDYFAVLEQYRKKGAGSVFLNEMKKYIGDKKGIIIETEDIDFAKDEADRLVREKRNDFYKRNGVINTNLRTLVCGVNYDIWCCNLDESVSENDYMESLDKIYELILKDGGRQKSCEGLRIYKKTSS